MNSTVLSHTGAKVKGKKSVILILSYFKFDILSIMDLLDQYWLLQILHQNIIYPD